MGKYHDTDPEDFDGNELVTITLSYDDAEALFVMLEGLLPTPTIKRAMAELRHVLYGEEPDVDDDFPIELEYPDENPLFPQAYGLDEPYE